jgi:GNAT superfamily N-acetyltransferase
MHASDFSDVALAGLPGEIEQATFDAVPPQTLAQVGPWWVGLDPGTVSRAHSAAPCSADLSALLGALGEVTGRYRDAALTPCLRIPDLPALEPLRRQLMVQGYRAGAATWVQRADCAEVLARVQPPPRAHAPEPGIERASDRDTLQVQVREHADDAWCALFLGPGFDPIDGASRTAILRRARHARYASVRRGDEIVAVGMGSFSRGWASIHGMRTAPGHRGQGLASAIIAALLRHALSQGFGRVFLQVEAANTHAHALYTRLGFADLWAYRYWRPTGNHT